MRSRSANEPTPPIDLTSEEAETVLVGYLVRPHGVRGELKIEIHSDNPERFAPGSELLLRAPRREPGQARRPPRTVTVTSFRPVRGGGLIAFAGCEDRDAAEELRGGRLEVELARIPAAPPGCYYHYELVGCRCFEVLEGELGEVAELLEDGGGHLLRIRRGGRDLLVPFVDAFLERVDVAARRIDLRLPPGLVETCASGS
ncbi:MAG TPA: ribosome maturation factor RimM [Thermoanaerobaculia bacterium]|jgi:16S rRNA processing protein RimM